VRRERSTGRPFGRYIAGKRWFRLRLARHPE
jgi:hypothetical protein